MGIGAFAGRIAVLDAQFGVGGERTAGLPALPVATRDELLATVVAYGGKTVEADAAQLVVTIEDPGAALSLARSLASRLRRLGGAFRIVLGFGHVAGEGALQAEWLASQRSLGSLLPPGTIGVQPLFGDQLPPADRELLLPVEHARGALLLLAESDEADRTRAAADGLGSIPVFDRLTLIVAGRRLDHRASDRARTLGRSRDCALVVAGEAVSRVHGRIEFRRDRFVYVDQSRNGSWVLTPAGEELHVHGEAIELIGEGAISPGLPLGEQTAAVVRYCCHSTRQGLGSDGETQVGVTRPL